MSVLKESTTELDILEAGSQAVFQLGDRLRQGQLAVMLGAGISIGMGLPSWGELVRRCCEATNTDTDGADFSTSGFEVLNRLIDMAEAAYGRPKGRTFNESVRDLLYRDSDYNLIWNGPRNELLNALGFLCLGSGQRRVSEVATLNFDVILEEFAALHGLTYASVSVLPQLEDSVDLKVFHLHGALERGGKCRSEIVFGAKRYNRRLAVSGQQNELWNSWLTNWILRKQLLIVGAGGSFDAYHPAFTKAFDLLSNGGPGDSNRKYVGYWLLAAPQKPIQLSGIRDLGCVPVVLNSHAEYSRFILDIRRSSVS